MIRFMRKKCNFTAVNQKRGKILSRFAELKAEPDQSRSNLTKKEQLLSKYSDQSIDFERILIYLRVEKDSPDLLPVAFEDSCYTISSFGKRSSSAGEDVRTSEAEWIIFLFFEYLVLNIPPLITFQ